MKHKTTQRIIISTFAIALFFIIIFGSLNFMIFNRDFYYREYQKNDVYSHLNGSVNVTQITDNMLKYFHGGDFDPSNNFNANERSHMHDVKVLISIMQAVYYSCALIIVILFYYLYKKLSSDRIEFIRLLSRSILYGSIAAIAFLIILFMLTVFSFDFLFTLFHVIFFSAGTWTFPSGSLLVTLFPEQFFSDIALRIFIFAMFQALIFLGIGYWMRKQLKMFDRYSHLRKYE